MRHFLVGSKEFRVLELDVSLGCAHGCLACLGFWLEDERCSLCLTQQGRHSKACEPA